MTQSDWVLSHDWIPSPTGTQLTGTGAYLLCSCISASLTPPICSISSFKFRKHFVKFEFAAKSNSPLAQKTKGRGRIQLAPIVNSV